MDITQDDVKKTINKVDDTEFWKQRLEDAKRHENLSESVYQVSQYEMGKIDTAHKKLLEDLISSGQKVLDAGCGYGRNAEWFDPENYVGVDFSPDFIREARILHPEYKFIQANLKKLPFKRHEFDVALCISVRHMIKYYLGDKEWEEMEKELRYVAKHLIFLEYPNPEQIEILWQVIGQIKKDPTKQEVKILGGLVTK